MKIKKNREGATVNTGSMADIAFLLLIFFLVTTTIASEKGIAMMLPPNQDQPPLDRHERNVLNILINSEGMLLADGEPMLFEEISSLVKKFVANPQGESHWAESPKEAIVSIKSDRGTNYATYIEVLDGVKEGYHSLRAEYLGVDLAQYHLLDASKATDKAKLDEAKKVYPMQVSEAEPSKVQSHK